MNKADKIKLLHDSIGTYNICRCFFTYDVDYWYFYILDCADKLFLGIEENDFMLDGFQIRKISDIKKIEIKDDICSKINRENKLLSDVKKPPIDLSSWKSVFMSLKALDVFMSLKALDKFIIVENENKDEDNGFFHLGIIKEVKDTFIIFSSVDADGIWYDNIKIPYSKITSVIFNDRYSKTWQEYLSK